MTRKISFVVVVAAILTAFAATAAGETAGATTAGEEPPATPRHYSGIVIGPTFSGAYVIPEDLYLTAGLAAAYFTGHTFGWDGTVEGGYHFDAGNAQARLTAHYWFFLLRIGITAAGDLTADDDDHQAFYLGPDIQVLFPVNINLGTVGFMALCPFYRFDYPLGNPDAEFVQMIGLSISPLFEL